MVLENEILTLPPTWKTIFVMIVMWSCSENSALIRDKQNSIKKIPHFEIPENLPKNTFFIVDAYGIFMEREVQDYYLDTNRVVKCGSPPVWLGNLKENKQKYYNIDKYCEDNIITKVSHAADSTSVKTLFISGMQLTEYLKVKRGEEIILDVYTPYENKKLEEDIVRLGSRLKGISVWPGTRPVRIPALKQDLLYMKYNKGIKLPKTGRYSVNNFEMRCKGPCRLPENVYNVKSFVLNGGQVFRKRTPKGYAKFFKNNSEIERVKLELTVNPKMIRKILRLKKLQYLELELDKNKGLESLIKVVKNSESLKILIVRSDLGSILFLVEI